MLEERETPYVLAVPVSQRVIACVDGKVAELRADALARLLPAQAWKKISAGAGAKGPRLYRWARAAIRPLEDTGGHWLLVRRSLSDPDDLAYYLCHGPERTPLRELVRVAGTRWAIEETFQTAKGQVGLAQYQVRRYDSWYRHITLAMLAHAFLTVTTAGAGGKGGAHRPVEELIPLTVPEVRRLLAHLIWHQPPNTTTVLDWSRWRRRHAGGRDDATTPPEAPPHICGCSTRRLAVFVPRPGRRGRRPDSVPRALHRATGHRPNSRTRDAWPEPGRCRPRLSGHDRALHRPDPPKFIQRVGRLGALGG